MWKVNISGVKILVEQSKNNEMVFEDSKDEEPILSLFETIAKSFYHLVERFSLNLPLKIAKKTGKKMILEIFLNSDWYIKDFHIRYENTSADQPFIADCTINEIQVSNLPDALEDRNWKVLCKKNVQIGEFAINLSINPTPDKWFSQTKSHGEILGNFNNIADDESDRIVGPVSCRTKAILQTGKNHWNQRKYFLDFNIPNLEVDLSPSLFAVLAQMYDVWSYKGESSVDIQLPSGCEFEQTQIKDQITFNVQRCSLVFSNDELNKSIFEIQGEDIQFDFSTKPSADYKRVTISLKNFRLTNGEAEEKQTLIERHAESLEAFFFVDYETRLDDAVSSDPKLVYKILPVKLDINVLWTVLKDVQEFLPAEFVQFCPECRLKVNLAYSLLMGEVDPSEEKGYKPVLYAGLKCCPNEKHVHVQIDSDLISLLIGRAEPELFGRERHAKTIEVGQEEVLTCVGICLLDRFQKAARRLREEHQAGNMLLCAALAAMRMSLDVTLEQKRGVSESKIPAEKATEVRPLAKTEGKVELVSPATIVAENLGKEEEEGWTCKESRVKRNKKEKKEQRIQKD